MKKDKSKLDEIYEEVAYETGEKPSVVKEIVQEVFIEAAFFLVTKNAPVMIRRFVKIVKALRTTKKFLKNHNDYETRDN
tara:strand:+ start:283 stop:519 length:237 start_codon:yes stop_codon:yes gene_type:complete